jgi:ribosomal protein L32
MIMMPPTADTRHHCRSKAWRRFGTPQARRHLTTRDSSAGPLRPPPTVENAVQHARTRFQVTAEITGGSLRVEVTDSGGGTPAAGRCRTRPACADAACSSSSALRRLGNQPISRRRHERMVHDHSRRRRRSEKRVTLARGAAKDPSRGKQKRATRIAMSSRRSPSAVAASRPASAAALMSAGAPASA